jgi:antitoxin component of RelBE/YafQ-DinJ toxin-antitoxin module
MTTRVPKIVFTFRIDPRVKEAAKRAAKELKLTISRYVENLIRLDLWRKGTLK